MHWSCGIVTRGKPTEEDIAAILRPYYGGDYLEADDGDKYPVWDWYKIGGRWAGIVATPSDTPESTLTYGESPMSFGDTDNTKEFYYTGLEVVDNGKAIVLCHHSDGAYVKDIVREAWDNDSQKMVPFRTFALVDIDGEYHEPENWIGDGIPLDFFNELVYNTGCDDAYLTLVDLHM